MITTFDSKGKWFVRNFENSERMRERMTERMSEREGMSERTRERE